MTGSSRSRRIVRRLAGALAGTLAALLATELVWRAVEPGPIAPPTIRASDGAEVPLSTVGTYLGRDAPPAPGAPAASRLTPNLDLRFCYADLGLDYLDADGCVRVATNDLGFRDEPFTREKPPGQTRVLAIGDSFTFGNGVRLEDTWVQRLEGLLEERLGDAEVVNGGFATGATRVGDYLDWIASDAFAFEPDLLVIGLCLNDLGDVPMAVKAPPVERRWLGGTSRVLNALQDRRQRARFERTPLPDATVLLDLVPEPWEAARATLTATRDLCAERGVGLLVVVFPMFFRLERERYPLLGVHQRVTEFCAAAEIPCVDLFETFEGMDGPSLWVHPSDQHANPRGQAIIADALLGPVLERLGE